MSDSRPLSSAPPADAQRSEFSAAPPHDAADARPAADAHALDQPTKPDIAGRSVPAHLCFWLVTAGGIALDLWSKDWAFRTLKQGGHRLVIPHVLEFQTMLNAGALFGIGRGRTELFLVASSLALLLVLWMFFQSPRKRWLLHIALGGIFAGAIGNMYDRVVVQLTRPMDTANGVRHMYTDKVEPDGHTILREYPPGSEGALRRVARPPEVFGHVRDFIKIPTKIFGDHDLWPWVFNTADALLVGGVAVLAMRLLLDGRQRRGALPPDETEAGPADTSRT